MPDKSYRSYSFPQASLLLAGAAVGWALLGACAPPQDEGAPPVFRAQAEGGGNRLAVQHDGTTTVFDVYSESGIGRANVQLESGTPPASILIRLHLTGLEQFRLVFNGTTLNVSVSSTGHTAQALHQDGMERPLAATSPLRLGVERRAADGYFELTLPSDFIERGAHSFAFEWIDFFR
jgi:hypothetical protein